MNTLAGYCFAWVAGASIYLAVYWVYGVLHRYVKSKKSWERGDCVIDKSFGTGVVLGPGKASDETMVAFDRYTLGHVSIPSYRLSSHRNRL